MPLALHKVKSHQDPGQVGVSVNPYFRKLMTNVIFWQNVVKAYKVFLRAATQVA